MQYKSPAFSDFRHLMDLWDESQEMDKVEAMLSANQLILFFKKNGNMYGAPESSRLVFARMKNPDKDTPKTYVDEANFMAVNLTKAVQGEEEKVVFGKSDLKDIKIIDQDEVKKLFVLEIAWFLQEISIRSQNFTLSKACNRSQTHTLNWIPILRIFLKWLSPSPPLSLEKR